MKTIKFTSFEDVTAEKTDNHLIIKLTGSRLSLDSIKKKLTMRDSSVYWNVKRLEGQIAKIKKEGFEGWDVECDKLKIEIKELNANEIIELWDDKGSHLEVPAGFWWIASTHVDNFHLNTEMQVWTEARSRDYQVEGVKALLKHKRASLLLATGCGKTSIISSICKSAELSGLRTCVVVPTDYLVEQTASSIKNVSDSVSMMGGGRNYKLGENICVTTAQSAMKVIDNFDVIVVDECLPYTQNILTEKGPMKIGQLYNMWIKQQDLPLVASFNENIKKIEYKKITYAWKRPGDKKILQINTSGVRIQCTPEHLILTRYNGWVPAKDLKEGDVLVGSRSSGSVQNLSTEELNEDQMNVVIGSALGDGSLDNCGHRYRLQIIHGKKQEDYCEWKSVFFDSKLTQIEKNGYSQKPAVRFCTKLMDLPFVMVRPKTTLPDSVISKINAKSLAIWFMDDGSFNQKSKTCNISSHTFDYETHLKLQSKLKEFEINAKIRTAKKDDKEYFYFGINSKSTKKFLELISPYMHPSMSYKTNLPELINLNLWNYEKTEAYTYVINKIIEKNYTKIKRYDGYGLFDLEIEDNHNFIACSRGLGGGIVMHNCQHSPASTWMNIFTNSPAKYVYSVSGTPYRSDGLDLGIFAFSGPLVYQRNARWGIENGWLKPCKVYARTINYIKDGETKFLSDKISSARAYKILTGSHHFLNELKLTVLKALKNGRKVMVLFKTVGAGLNFKLVCKGEVEFNVASSENKKPLHDFKEGKTKILVSNDKLVGEGVDVSDCDCVIICTNHASEGLTSQIVGRALRKSPGQNDALIIDFTLNGYSQFLSSQEKRLASYSTITDDVFVLGG